MTQQFEDKQSPVRNLKTAVSRRCLTHARKQVKRSAVPPRKPKTPAKAEEAKNSDPFEELLAALEKDGLDWDRGPQLWKKLADQGPNVIRTLLDRIDDGKPFKLLKLALQKVLEGIAPELRGQAAYILDRSLERTVALERRIAAIQAFAHTFKKDPRCQQRLLSIACDRGEDTLARTEALKTLAEMEPDETLAPRLLEILDVHQEHWAAPEPEPKVPPRDEAPEKARMRALAALTDAAFLCLRQHAARISTRKLIRALEPFLTHDNARLRRRAIELVGAGGDIDMVEHLFALPHARLHMDDIHSAAAAIGSRPVNLLSLRPEAFEAFIGRVLRWMKFEDVDVTRYSGDGGLDAICYAFGKSFKEGQKREKCVVQCKRYSRDPINREMLEKFAKAMKAEKSHRGLFVTTSHFTEDALAFAEGEQNIELVSGKDLLERLNPRDGAKRYEIRPHGND